MKIVLHILLRITAVLITGLLAFHLAEEGVVVALVVPDGEDK
jgi:hypothetical protein